MTARACTVCGRITHHGNRCGIHTTLEIRRRDTKRRDNGLTTARWQRLRLAALHRDGHTCQRCGQPANTVHILPELQGNHRIATLNDCTTLCHHCHGTIDALRAHASKPIRGGGIAT